MQKRDQENLPISPQKSDEESPAFLKIVFNELIENSILAKQKVIYAFFSQWLVVLYKYQHAELFRSGRILSLSQAFKELTKPTKPSSGFHDLHNISRFLPLYNGVSSALVKEFFRYTIYKTYILKHADYIANQTLSNLGINQDQGSDVYDFFKKILKASFVGIADSVFTPFENATTRKATAQGVYSVKENFFTTLYKIPGFTNKMEMLYKGYRVAGIKGFVQGGTLLETQAWLTYHVKNYLNLEENQAVPALGKFFVGIGSSLAVVFTTAPFEMYKNYFQSIKHQKDMPFSTAMRYVMTEHGIQGLSRGLLGKSIVAFGGHLVTSLFLQGGDKNRHKTSPDDRHPLPFWFKPHPETKETCNNLPTPGIH